MARSLDVYLHTNLAGQLIQDDFGLISFKYAQGWLANPRAAALSRSLPLREDTFTRKECRGFFGGILPEGAQRMAVAKSLGVSERNDFALLERIGGECAGAVTFIPSGSTLSEQVKGYRSMTDEDLAKVLELLRQRPLLAGEDGIRLSLAGAQNKLAVRVSREGISIPLGDSPSTHILKPASAQFEGLIENEAFCLNLAPHGWH